MRERLLRKYKKEVNNPSVDFYTYCKNNLSQQLAQKACDEIDVNIIAMSILYMNGIYNGVSK